MASSYSELKFELIATGEQSGTWGNTTNENIGTAINEAIAGMADVTIDGNTTLTWLNTVATQKARHYALRLLPGVVAAPFNLVVPTIHKPYVILNSTSYTATVKTSSGSGVAVPAGKSAALYTDGVNVIPLFTYSVNLSLQTLELLGAPLAISSGGTGANAIASGVVTSNGSVLSSVAAPSGDLVGTTATQTLTNKIIQMRIQTASAYGTPFNPNCNDYDMFIATAQGGSIAFGAPAGTPFNGQKIIFRITFSAGGSISFDTGSNGYRAVGVTLPTTSTGGQTLYLGCMWNSLAAKWDVLAVNVGA